MINSEFTNSHFRFKKTYYLCDVSLKYNQTLAMHPYIVVNPDIRFGKPCIEGTRIAVQDILGWLAAGMSFEEIMEDFPELDLLKIRAALAFAAYREMRTKTLLYREAAA